MKILGWHNLSEELILFHGALKQFLQEPAINLERMKMEALSMKVFIESVIDTPKEDSDGNEGMD